jgi:hypothetical protein
MTVSVRSYLTAGTAAMVVGAMAIAPTQPSAPSSITAAGVRLSAAVQPLVNDVNAAAVTLGRSAAASASQQPQAAASPQANNNVSDAIDAAYNVIMYWGDYWANQLGPYLLGWVPFGYLISDQIQIWYNTFTVPVSASFVYDFLDPVVNDFWNPTVWRDGLTALANTTFAQLGQTINAEVYYVVSLQWFPFPLPPLPPLPFAALKVPAAAASTAAAADEAATPAKAPTKVSGLAHSARPQATKPSTDATDATPTAEAVTDTTATHAVSAKVTTADKAAKAADSSGPASGKSNSAKSGADSGKKSTGGSARSHGPKSKGGNGS